MRVFLVCYVLAAVFIYRLAALFLLDTEVIYLVIFSIVFLLAGVFAYAWFYILFSIPQRLAHRIDVIKDAIADRSIKTREDFSDEMSRFMVEFYNYSFFDIQYAAFKVKDSGIRFSSPLLEKSMDWEVTEEALRTNADAVRKGMVKIEDKAFNTFGLPVFFGDEYLGFFMVFTKSKFRKLHIQLLEDLENNYIDDQLLHIINISKSG